MHSYPGGHRVGWEKEWEREDEEVKPSEDRPLTPTQQTSTATGDIPLWLRLCSVFVGILLLGILILIGYGIYQLIIEIIQSQS